MVLHYQSYLKNYSRVLRNNCTKEEQLLWFYLRKRNILGFQFYRQRPIDDYVVDFVCMKLKLIIEVDGSDHEYKYDEDLLREEKLKNLGFIILRIKNNQIRNNLEGVVKFITENVDSLSKRGKLINIL